MSKRDKTTGLPAQSKRVADRKYLSRAEREQRANRIILTSALIIAGAVVVLLLAAVLVDNVIRPSQSVASVGSASISARDFERRVRFERWRTGLQVAAVAQFAPQLLQDQTSPFYASYQNLQIPSLMGQQVLNDMVDGLVIKQYAADNGITVNDDEIDKYVYDLFGFQPTPMTETPTRTPSLTLTPLVSATPSPTATQTTEPSETTTPIPATSTPVPTGVPTATPGPTEQYENFVQNRRDYIDEAARLTGYGEAEIRAVFAEEALREKVLRAVAGDPPTEQEQIKARHILVKSSDEAQEILAALQQGEPFAALARANSTDQGSKDQGGELGWQGKGVYVPEFEEAIWNAEPGQILGPIDTTANGENFGFHIIQVEERAMRPLTDSQAQQVQQQVFSDWLESERERLNAQTFSAWRDFVPEEPTLADLGLG
ncbi:MAG: peptidylprolyl isomerase [Anaerolineae bacterium]|nr:peptidylprolyl isomerase [Anaerolineae bacterium]